MKQFMYNKLKKDMKFVKVCLIIYFVTTILHTGCQIFWPNFLNNQLHWLTVILFSLSICGAIWTSNNENFFKRVFGNIYTELAIGIFIVFFIFFIYTRIIAYNFPSNWTERGQFGDMFGGLNVFFASLVFIIAYASWRMQSRELFESKKSSELNTKIAALQSYISSFAPNQNDEKKEMAQNILHQLTAEYFNDINHKHLFEPKLNISIKKPTWKNFIYAPEIEILNIGYSINIEVISSEPIDLTNLYLKPKDSKTIQFNNLKLDIRDANKVVTLDIKYVSINTIHVWKEKVEIRFTNQYSEVHRSGLKD